jgi:hypothetical protein
MASPMQASSVRACVRACVRALYGWMDGRCQTGTRAYRRTVCMVQVKDQKKGRIHKRIIEEITDLSDYFSYKNEE